MSLAFWGPRTRLSDAHSQTRPRSAQRLQVGRVPVHCASVSLDSNHRVPRTYLSLPVAALLARLSGALTNGQVGTAIEETGLCADRLTEDGVGVGVEAFLDECRWRCWWHATCQCHLALKRWLNRAAPAVVDVLVAGSLHLVGGVIEVAGLSSVAL